MPQRKIKIKTLDNDWTELSCTAFLKIDGARPPHDYLLGIHLANKPKGTPREFTITHIPTGQAIANYRTKKQAEADVHHLVESLGDKLLPYPTTGGGMHEGVWGWAGLWLWAMGNVERWTKFNLQDTYEEMAQKYWEKLYDF